MLSEIGVIREFNRIGLLLGRKNLSPEIRAELEAARSALGWAVYQEYPRPSEWFAEHFAMEDAQIEQSNSQR